MSSLVHELQKERGMTAGYLGSGGVKFKDKLPQQRESTNRKKIEFQNFLKTVDVNSYGNAFTILLNDSLKRLTNLDSKRSQVSSLSIGGKEAISYYTNMNGSFLEIIRKTASYSPDTKMAQQLNAYTNFLLAKERAGIERAIGAVTFAENKYLKGMRIKFNKLVALQDGYLDSFIKLADKKTVDYYNNTVQGNAINEVNRIREIALTTTTIGGFGIKSDYWFKTITSKINKLKQVENHISSNLITSNNSTQELIKIAQAISNILHETQKERGATAGYLGSKGKRFKDILPNQRKNTDDKRVELLSVLKNTDLNNYPLPIQEEIKILLKNLNHTISIRGKIDSLEISAKNAIGTYTRMNAQFLNTISLMAKFPENAKIAASMTSFYNFLMSKERAGIERAVMANVFAADKFTGTIKTKFSSLIVQQDTFITSFLASSTPEVVKFYEKTVSGKDIDEVNRMRKVALESSTIGGFGVDSAYWFEQITAKINMLKKVDDQIANTLVKDAGNIASSAFNNLIEVIVLAIFLVILALVLGVIIANRMVSALENFQKGLENFFKFLNYEIDDVELLRNGTKDEFGKMADNVNKNISKTKENILQDRKLIDETIVVSNRINKGHLDGQITVSSANPALNELKNILNNTISKLNSNLVDIENVLDEYTKLNYLPVVEKNSMEGIVEHLIDGINSLGETITETLVVNKRNGLTLESSADTLITNVDKLNRSSNEAAASLEETAAALEEITSTIINNSDNVTSMARYASKVTTSANEGENLANNTMTAMDEINDQVVSINEAITVIDQIAFQTNILSLNAAVEAATAGEAGKGFAVVAQEVRNLASRSAEAAREIKTIVEAATLKATTGKDIANNMLTGYKSLNKDIEKTLDLIQHVDAASKEQQAGIEQINGAVTELDQQTQQNAAASLETHEIAIGTQKLSETIVSEANKKEFRGKNMVEDRRNSCRDLNYKGEERRSAEAHIRNNPKEKRQGAVKVANTTEFITHRDDSSYQTAEAWESF
jgi:methyl-accepting chemotaxis protein